MITGSMLPKGEPMNPYQSPVSPSGHGGDVAHTAGGLRDPRGFGYLALAAITAQIAINAVQLTVPLDEESAATLTACHVVAWVLSAVFFLIWKRRCVLNVRRINPHLGLTAGWAVGCYFIPFVQWVAPAMVMRTVIGETFRRKPQGFLMVIAVVWWGAYMLRSLLMRLITNSHEITVVWSVASVISWLAALILVIRIGSRQAVLRRSHSAMVERPILVALDSRSGDGRPRN
jgi:hypothetical protein